jgi:ribosome-binding factor A
VDVAPDLADAQVHVSVLPADRSELVMHGLRDAAGFIQREIGSAITARRLPRLHFRLDDSLKRQAALDAALADGGAPPAHETGAPGVSITDNEDSGT